MNTKVVEIRDSWSFKKKNSTGSPSTILTGAISFRKETNGIVSSAFICMLGELCHSTEYPLKLKINVFQHLTAEILGYNDRFLCSPIDVYFFMQKCFTLAVYFHFGKQKH